MKKIILGLFMIVCFSQCKVAFVPARNNDMLLTEIHGANTTDSVYKVALASNDKSYVTAAPGYDLVKSIITHVLDVAKTRNNSSVLVSQIEILQSHFNYYVQQHQKMGVLNNAELQTYQLDMAAYWQPVIVSESSYK